MVDYPCTTYDMGMIERDRRNGHTAAMERAVQARKNAETHYTYRAPDGAVVQLGNKALADAQRAADEAAGGLVARICRGEGRR